MDNDYKSGYANLYLQHWWWRAREKILHHLLDRDLKKPSKDFFVLDVGCGDGWFLDSLPAVKKLGLEIDSFLVSPQNIESGKVVIGEFKAIYELQSKVDLLCLLDVIEHIEDDLAFLREAASFLKPNGKVLISVPAMPSLWTIHDEVNHHKRRYVKKQLREVLSKAGFSVEFCEYGFFSIVFLKLLVRLYEKLLPPKGNVSMTIPPAPVNSILKWISHFEFLVISKLGLSFPFGSSLFAIAKTSADFKAK